MEVAVDGCRLTAGDSGVDRGCCDDRGSQRDGVVLWSGTGDAAPPSSLAVAVDENHRPSPMNGDNDQWTECRRESVWLEYLYTWNPLSAGNRRIN